MRDIYLSLPDGCPFCGGVLTPENIQIDHVIRRTVPEIKGNPMNLFASDGCGSSLDFDQNGNRLPMQKRVELIRRYLPGRYEWLEWASVHYRFPLDYKGGYEYE